MMDTYMIEDGSFSFDTDCLQEAVCQSLSHCHRTVIDRTAYDLPAEIYLGDGSGESVNFNDQCKTCGNIIDRCSPIEVIEEGQVS